MLSVAESPELTTTVGAKGEFSLMAPSDGECSFLVRQPGYHDTKTAALPVPASGLQMVGFQVPSDATFNLLAAVINLEPDPERCQIATTISRAGTAPYGGDALGEPDVIASIEPPLPAASGRSTSPTSAME